MKMVSHILLGSVFISCLIIGTQGSVKGYISHSDKNKFASVLSKSLLTDEFDFSSVYYSIIGYGLLKKQIDSHTIQSKCKALQTNFKGDEPVEIIFQALSAWSKLGCSGKIYKQDTIKLLHNVANSETSSLSDIRYAVEALTVISENISNPVKISQLLQGKLKEDDSLQALGHAFHTSIYLGSNEKFIADRVEDVVVQLDEVNGMLLQWEGGLSTTSHLLTGLLKLNSVKPFTQVQADKIANYLLTRKTVLTSRGVVALLEAIIALTKSSVSPVSIGIIGKPLVTIDKPELKVRVSDLLGEPLKPVPGPVVAVSATSVINDVVVLSKQPLSAGSTLSEFLLPLRLDPDHYQIVLNAGTHSVTLHVRVVGPVVLKSFEIGLADVDAAAVPRLSKLDHPNKLQSVLQADSSHLLIAKFSLSRSVHQSFLRLYSPKREIVFVAEQDSSKLYKIEVNLNSEFTFSGLFDIELILGDPVVSNPLKWNLGQIDINLGKEAPDVKTPKGPKPEIKHLFRQAEKRPPTAVSLFFSVLSGAPLLLLLVLWLRIGVNFKNFSLVSLPFHLGFGSILCLFLCFWLKLDMFTTCAWLIPLGAFTFLSGHKVLSTIANSKKSDKTE